ncbi:geranylgeranyl reductase family protein [Thermogladius sp. 4427co]|uniref:geranylgeranyl reductase family protein n=1 Tax=Thermogladius sp. 4427co TaxID=3450718 RepID=UPI003F796524
MFDVAVIGAGVGGLYSSLVLAERGFRVALIESKSRSRIGDKTCGDAIGLHHLEHIGLSLPDDIVDHRYRGVKIKSPSEKHEIIVPGEGISVNRVKLGQWLLKNALDHGVELLDEHFLVGVEVRDGRVDSVRVKKIGGGVVEVRARFYIDASGAKPALRSKLPPEWPISERPLTTDFNIAYREVVDLEDSIDSEDIPYAVIYLNQVVAPGGYWWMFPKNSSGTVVNVGLGVINNGVYNPRHNYEKYLRGRFKGRLVHAGGGIVPTRRPMPTLVWSNVGTVGDAAYTVNPVHGGGIGSTLEAANIMSTHLSRVLEEGEPTTENMWEVNLKYLEAYGVKQAGLDVLRMYLQKLSNEDFEWIIRNRLVDGSAVYEIGVKGSLADRVVSAVSTMIKLLGRPSLLNELRIVRNYMNKVMSLYRDEYPRGPAGIEEWMAKVEALFSEYSRVIDFDRGEKVKW